MVGDVGVFADRDVVDDGGDIVMVMWLTAVVIVVTVMWLVLEVFLTVVIMVMVMWLTALVMLVTVMRLMTMVIRMTLM